MILIHHQYYSGDHVKKGERFAGHVARMVEKRNCYKTLVDKLEGNGLHGRPRLKWENNIKKRDMNCNDKSTRVVPKVMSNNFL